MLLVDSRMRMREIFQESLNNKVESLKFNNVEDEWNNFRKIICKVADGVLGKKVRSAARDISEKALCFRER